MKYTNLEIAEQIIRVARNSHSANECPNPGQCKSEEEVLQELVDIIEEIKTTK